MCWSCDDVAMRRVTMVNERADKAHLLTFYGERFIPAMAARHRENYLPSRRWLCDEHYINYGKVIACLEELASEV